MKNIMFAAVAALFVVSAHANDAAKTAPAAPTTKEACEAAKGTWDAKANTCTPAAPAKK